MTIFVKVLPKRLFCSFIDLEKNFQNCKLLEDQFVKECSSDSAKKHWRSVWSKIYFNYLFLDPRLSCILPLKTINQEENSMWCDFYSSVFYVGKGSKTRPYQHLHQASKLFRQGKTTQNRTLKQIMNIWRADRGVVCLHVFHNSLPAEALTREAAMIMALGLWNLTNIRKGTFYGAAKSWTEEQKRLFGMYFLHRCMKIYKNEGGTELFHKDFE